jgi:hypothetical protein
VNKVDYIFLVGGFAESKLLLQSVRAAFERDGLRVVVPGRPGLAVLRGAVILGLGASTHFTSRIARLTYGVKIGIPYKPTEQDHCGRPTFVFQGVTYVNDSFSLIVRKGVSIKVEEVHRSIDLKCISGSGEILFEFFATSLEAVKWTSEFGVAWLGQVRLPATVLDSVHVELSFGRAEMHAMAVNARTGERRSVALDYGFRAT